MNSTSDHPSLLKSMLYHFDISIFQNKQQIFKFFFFFVIEWWLETVAKGVFLVCITVLHQNQASYFFSMDLLLFQRARVPSMMKWPHFHHGMRNYLITTFLLQLIGCSGPIAWHPLHTRSLLSPFLKVGPTS